MIKFILLFLFSSSLQAQISGPTDVNILSGSVTLSGPSSVTQSGSWGVSLLAGSAAIGSINNTAFGATQSGVWNVGLSAGSNVIGSISNTGFGITGTLPAFASTPTFNIGSGAFVDRTTAAAPYSFRLSDGSSFYDGRQIRALTSADVVSINGTVPVSGTFFQATQPVSIASSVAVTGPLTDTQLRATAVPVSLPSTTISNFPSTQPISAATLPLPTGASTSALQTTGNNSLNSIDVKLPNLGQVTSAASWPVTIASDQSAIPVTRANGSTLTEQQSQTTALQILDNAVGTVAPGAASTATQTQGVIHNTTLPTATTGQGLATQSDSRGRIYVKDFTLYTKSLKQYTALFTASTAEAILTLTPSTNYVVAANATTFAVSANKILRLTTLCVTTRNAGAASQGVVVRLRINPTGAAVLTSPVFKQIAVGTSIAVANNSAGNCVPLDESIELTGANQFALTQVGTATANNQVTLVGYEYE